MGNLRRLSVKSSSHAEPNARNLTPECEASIDDVVVSMEVSINNSRVLQVGGWINLTSQIKKDKTMKIKRAYSLVF